MQTHTDSEKSMKSEILSCISDEVSERNVKWIILGALKYRLVVNRTFLIASVGHMNITIDESLCSEQWQLYMINAENKNCSYS